MKHYYPSTAAKAYGCPDGPLLLGRKRTNTRYPWAYLLHLDGTPAWNCNREFFNLNFHIPKAKRRSTP